MWRHVARPGAAVALVTALFLAGCGTAEPAAPVAGDPGLVHVHGVASDPEDPAVLVAATHTGLFRVTDGQATRVGDALHDLMGFTVASDGTFLASGHPDLQSDELRTEDGSPHLGLVRSTDGGVSWEPVSLLGQVDFHALTVTGTSILGADATNGRFLASEDGGFTWEARSEIALVSVVADAEDSERLLGSTAESLVLSTDAGRSWSAITAAPPGFVAHFDQGFAVARADGTVATSEDGQEWIVRGQLDGQPTALNGSDGTLHVAVDGGGLLTSEDAGETWTTRYTGP